jgi:hypothetical protein
MLGANLLESLFVLSFNHQNPKLGLIALTITIFHTDLSTITLGLFIGKLMKFEMC